MKIVTKTINRMLLYFRVNILKPFNHFFSRKENEVLIYLGMHRGWGFDQLFFSHKVCYGFEANPELYNYLKRKYRFYRNVYIINAAVTNYNGRVRFNLSKNDGASSSIGELKAEWENRIEMIKTIDVEAINLFDFLKKIGVSKIDTYCSDIQGNDLTVLKTMKDFIDKKLIITITCETTKDNCENVYKLGDNSETGFKELLNKNYNLVAKGWGILKENEFSEVDENWVEMDCMWKVKVN